MCCVLGTSSWCASTTSSPPSPQLDMVYQEHDDQLLTNLYTNIHIATHSRAHTNASFLSIRSTYSRFDSTFSSHLPLTITHVLANAHEVYALASFAPEISACSQEISRQRPRPSGSYGQYNPALTFHNPIVFHLYLARSVLFNFLHSDALGYAFIPVHPKSHDNRPIFINSTLARPQTLTSDFQEQFL